MAYVSPSTKTTGDLIDAAEWNQTVVNNEKASAPDAFTTKGDLFVATAADTGTRLAAGANGKILACDSTKTGGLDWISAPTLNYYQGGTAGLGSAASPGNLLNLTLTNTNFISQGGNYLFTTAGTATVSGTVTYPVAFSSQPYVLPSFVTSDPNMSIILDGYDTTKIEFRYTPSAAAHKLYLFWYALGPA